MKIEIECRWCGNLVPLEAEAADLSAWQNGELIQNALPYLTADEREMLISRTCGTCWDEMFASDEDEEFESSF